jgi:basic amino acid/polyamine antiporter, APA family
VTKAEPSYKLIERQIGLAGGTVLLVGTVIGISVFLLPGELIAQAGPSIVLALALTALPMVFSVLGLLQLGGAIPVAGGLYVYASRLVGPFWGFLSIWLVIPAIWSTLLFTSIGFAEFTRFFVDIPAGVLMAAVLIAFLVLNLMGVTFVAWVQLVMVSGIILAILSFIIPGTGQIDFANYTPMFPNGIAPVLLAVVSLYIPFQGFSMIVELGEELKDPITNIPRVLMLGMSIAVLLSLGLVFVFVGLDNWEALAGLGPGGIAQAAAEYLPAWVGVAIATAAVLGAFTTLNAVITSYSRTLMRASRDQITSPKLAAIHPRTQVPHWSILVLSLPPLLFVPISPSVVTLTVFLALIILFGNFVGSIALWNLPKRYPERYEHSIYKLPMTVVKVSAIGSATFAVLFWLAVLSSAPAIVGVLLVLVAAGYGYYRIRIRSLATRGIHLVDRLKKLHDHEMGHTSAAAPAPEPAAAPANGPRPAAAPEPARTAPEAAPRPPEPRPAAAPEPRPTPGAEAPPAAEAVPDPATNGDGALESITGLGPAKTEELLNHFGSVERIRAATPDELMEVPGIGELLARAINRELA